MRAVRELAPEVTVVPSILAADGARLREQVLEVVDAGAHAIHVDVMDGQFVTPYGFDAASVLALREALAGRNVLIDVHLMVEWPERHVPAFASAGADVISVHQEARSDDLRRTLDSIRAAGCLAGAAIRPSTHPRSLDPLAGSIDVALCMTVEPGFGGQQFIENSPARLAALRNLLGAGMPVEVDGGIDARTGRICASAGARLLVAGTAIFATREPGAAFAALSDAVTRERV